MLKVLVVSPNDLRSELSTTVLGQAEVEWLVARDGETGFELARKQQPSLSIVALGDREAAEAFARRIRGDQLTRSCGLVVLVSSVLPPEEESLIGAGASAVLAGRVDPFLWNPTLQKLLRVPARREVSIPVRLWVWFRLSPEEEPARGLVLNVSANGMLVEAERLVDVEKGTKLEAEFKLPGSFQPLNVVARVAWGAGSGEGRPRFGIEFLNLDGDVRDRIQAFVSAARNR